jgi:hypothetical protein
LFRAAKYRLRTARRLLICNSLQSNRLHFSQFSKTLFAGLLIGVVLFMTAMASSEALHKLVHHDADQAGHECAATLFAHGQVDSAVCDVPAVIPTAPVESNPLAEFSVFSSTVENLPLGRAPPSFCTAS